MGCVGSLNFNFSKENFTLFANLAELGQGRKHSTHFFYDLLDFKTYIFLTFLLTPLDLAFFHNIKTWAGANSARSLVFKVLEGFGFKKPIFL